MTNEWPIIEGCCGETADWMMKVLEARCDQYAERGEPQPEGCR